MKFSKNSIITFIFTAPSVILVYLISVLITRFLGAEGEGNIALVMNLALTVSYFGGMGLNISNIYFYNTDNSKLNKIYWNSVLYILIFSMILIGIYYFLTPIILKNVFRGYINAVYPVVAFSLFINVFISTLSARLWFIRYGIVYILHNVIYLLSILVLIVIGRFTLLNTIYAVVLAYFITFIVCYILSGKGIGRSGPDLLLLKESIKYGIKGHLGNIFQRFNYKLDLYFINFLIAGEAISEVGYYSIAAKVAEVLIFIPRSVSTVLFPVVASIKDEKEAGIITARICRITFLIVFIVAVLLLLFGNLIIPFCFGKDFSKSIVPMFFLLPGIVFLSVANILSNYFLGKGLPQIGAYSSFIALIATIIFDFLLIPKFGIIGASVASSISYMTCTFCFVYFFIKKTGLPVRSFMLVNKDDIKYIIDTLKNKINGNSS